MGTARFSRGSSRKLTVLLLAVVAPPAITLIWLGLRLLDQDQALVAQRALEQRQVIAQNAARSLEQSLTTAERSLMADPVAEGMVRFLISPAGVVAEPPDRILWVAAPPAMQEADTQRFTDLERQEFREDPTLALPAYEKLTQSKDQSVRAAALLRVGRVERRLRHWTAAVDAYHALAQIRTVALDSVPVDLIARRALTEILTEAGRSDDAANAAASLETDFLAGRWMLDRPAWQLTASDLERWTGHTLPLSPERLTLSLVAEALWADRATPSDRSATNRSLIAAENVYVTVLAQRQAGEERVLAIGPSLLNTWIQRAVGSEFPGAQAISLLAPSGETLAGAQPDAEALKLSAIDTGLPWTVAVTPGDSLTQLAELNERRRLLGLGLAAILVLFCGGSYFLWRVVRREVEVARLQTDFVAAVSHEFRTPLTSLRHVTELLQEDHDLSPARRHSFYEALDRNTRRLQRLVESLLDFARMEGGRKLYQRQRLDVGELVAGAVSEFRPEAMTRGFEIDLDLRLTAPAEALVDAPSLTNALWNLLDNAVKYSPDGRTIHVVVSQTGSNVTIAVRDAGLGVPVKERQAIFERFVRGEKASQLGIKGTGLGLAMVSHIVHAHDGTIELESQEGAGSTFTVVLPLEARDFGPQNETLHTSHLHAKA